MTKIRILFDGPPGPVAGHFVEVETLDGESVRVGKWVELAGGMWALEMDAKLDEPPKPVAEMAVRLRWDPERLGPLWMNADNLRLLLYSDHSTRPELLQLDVLTGPTIGEDDERRS